jgi:cell division septum initiation protein DivIVA
MTEPEMSQINALLDKIERLVLNSAKLPLVNRVMVDEDKLFDLLDELRQQLPAEVEQAKQIVQHKSAIMAEAQRRAEQIITTAEKKARGLVSENEILREAQDEAENLRRRAGEESQIQQEGADRYADEVLSNLEQKISRALTTIQNGRNQLTRS